MNFLDIINSQIDNNEILRIFYENSYEINIEIYNSEYKDEYIYYLLGIDDNLYNLIFNLIQFGLYFDNQMLINFINKTNLQENKFLFEKLFLLITNHNYYSSLTIDILNNLFLIFFAIDNGQSYLNKYLLSFIIKHNNNIYENENYERTRDIMQFIQLISETYFLTYEHTYLRLVISNNNIIDAYLYGNSEIFEFFMNNSTYGISIETINIIEKCGKKKIYELFKELISKREEKNLAKYENSFIQNTNKYIKCPDILKPSSLGECKNGLKQIYINNIDELCCSKEELNNIDFEKHDLRIIEDENIFQKNINPDDSFDISLISKTLKLYTFRGDRVINSYIHNNFELDIETIKYIDWYKDLFSYFLEKYDAYTYDNYQYYFNYQKTIDNIIHILNSSYTEFNSEYGIVYRGINTSNIIPIEEEKTFISYNRFLSTSFDKEIGEEFIKNTGILYEIIIPKNSRILPILKNHSKFEYESEILLNYKSIFYVYEVKPNFCKLILIDGILNDEIINYLDIKKK